MTNPQVKLFTAVLALVAALGSACLLATTLSDFTLDELISHSTLILEGEVLSHEQSADSALVYTTVTLRVDEVLKGDASLTSVPLKFMGGSDGEQQVAVSGQFIPDVGARGIFFINDPDDNQVNPLTGWYQGFFREIQVPGEATVYLDLHERPDLILVNLPTDPMLKKLLGLGMSDTEIAQRFPDYQRFPAADFKDYIRYQTSREGF